jgi:transposase
VTTSDTCRSRDVAEVVLGVDTHLDFHVAVALDQLGKPLGGLKVSTTTRGYRHLVSWAEGFGPVRCAGVEGTGSYGASLARHLKDAGILVMEVERDSSVATSNETARAIPKTPRPQPARSWLARRRAYRRAGAVVWR